ncbi:YcaO-like family protein [compost metagenome]
MEKVTMLIKINNYEILNFESDTLLYTKSGITKINSLLDYLCSAGHLHLFDISDHDLPGCCVIAIYGSNTPSRAVKYCAGMSYADNQKSAIEKSLLELWQTFRFMNLFYKSKTSLETISDDYLKHFLSCNHSATLDLFESVIENPPLSKNQAPLTTPNILSILNTRGLHSYIYLDTVSVNGSDFHACKFVSPSMFMHMNNAENININNLYSDNFNENIIDSRKSTMVPFP